MTIFPDKAQFNFKLLIKELLNRKINLTFIKDTDIVEAEFKGHKEILLNSDTSLVPSQYINLFADKCYAKKFLMSKGFPTPAGEIFRSDRMDLALFYADMKIGFPVAIKPNISDGGYHVFANIQDKNDFRVCFQEVCDKNVREILVEKQVEDCEDYRFFVTKGGYVAVVKRTLPFVIGDGKLSVIDLIEQESYRRMNPRNTCLCEIWMGDLEPARVLSLQGKKIDDIPKIGEKVIIRYNSNVGSGGDCIDVTEDVHVSYIEIAKSILEHCPGLGYFGVDLLIKDSKEAANENNYSVLEINHRPGYSLHTSPGTGKSRDVIVPLVDLLFPETLN